MCRELEWRLKVNSLPWPFHAAPIVTFRSAVDDINITLMRSPEELREDKSVFMNQGEWELLHILSNYKSFSLDNDDYYAEMKFHVGCFPFIRLLKKKERRSYFFKYFLKNKLKIPSNKTHNCTRSIKVYPAN